MNLRRAAQVAAITFAIGIGAGAVQGVAAPLFQDHDQNAEHDYSKNKTYQQGMRDGKNDRAHNMDHSRKRHYKKDDDNKAYEAGYQKSRN